MLSCSDCIYFKLLENANFEAEQSTTMKRHAILLMTATRLTIFGCVLAGLSLNVVPFSPKAMAAPEGNAKPNIVLINMDNFGYGELGCYGGGITRGAPTPRIDKLASEGMRLTNFNVEAQCTPCKEMSQSKQSI